jgi:chromosome partitioning protein
MKIIALANHKGGVGKTTSVLNIGHALTARGHQVLLVDCDPQANLTQSFTYAPPPHLTMAAVLLGKMALGDIVQEVAPGLYLAPASPELGAAEKQLQREPGAEVVLRELLEQVEGIDYVLLDTPGGLGTLTYAALAAATAVFIPTQPEYYGLEGLAGLVLVCQQIKKRLNPGLLIGGLFFTQYNRNDRRRVHRDLVLLLEGHATLGPLVMLATVRANVAVQQAQTEKQNLLEHYPDSAGALDYQVLTAEILTRLQAD